MKFNSNARLALHFDDDLSFNEEVEAISAVDPRVLVDHGQGDFGCERDLTGNQLKGKAALVGGLEEAWAKLSVHLDGRADHRSNSWVFLKCGHTNVDCKHRARVVCG